MSIDASVPAVAAGLIGGYAVARYTGKRPLGGVVLAAAGVAAGSRWIERGPATTAALTAVYLGAFGVDRGRPRSTSVPSGCPIRSPRRSVPGRRCWR